MVCIYCGSPTAVTNSRLTSTANHVWRRRQCSACKAVFTTEESADMAAAFRVDSGDGVLQTFSRDKLFMSIYSSLGHRTTALDDATALTRTIVAKIAKAQKQSGIIDRTKLVHAALKTLKAFDNAAATHYAAYHPVRN